jgi:hypothetical protein
MKSKQFSVLFLFCVLRFWGSKKYRLSKYNGAFRAQGMDEFSIHEKTNQYTVLNVDSRQNDANRFV